MSQHRTPRRIGFVAAQAAACLLAWWWKGLPGAQWTLFAITMAWVSFRYFFVLDLIARLLIDNAALSLLVIAFYATLSGMAGTSLGVMNLFWHEDLATRFAAAFFSTAFFGLIFLAAFYAGPDKEATQRRLEGYLRNDRTLGDVVRVAVEWIGSTSRSLWDWFRGRGWESPGRDLANPPEPDGDPGEPSVQDYVKRFLTVFFYPFWWILTLPAVAPVAYAYLPKTVPTKLAGLPIPWISPEANNVETVPVAWLAGLLIWGAGAVAGYFAIWGYVEVNRRLYGALDARLKDDRTLRSPLFDAVLNWACPLPPEAWEEATTIPPGSGASWKEQVQQAVFRYMISVFAVYSLACLANLILGVDWSIGPADAGRRPSSPEDRIAMGSWIGAGIFAASVVGMILFLRARAWAYRRAIREARGNIRRPETRDEWCHLALTIGLGIGLALVGLRSAIFQVFIVLAVFAITAVVIVRFSESWNWPLAAFPLRVLIPVLLVLLLWWTNSSPSKLRIPNLEGHYEGRVAIQPTLDEAVKAGSEDDGATLAAWKAVAQASMPAGADGTKAKPKLAILATSGGANRAALWTAAVLERLDRLATVDGQPDFRAQLRLITGASGGMVGAAFYVAELNQPGALPAGRREPGWLIDRIPPDSLSPVARQWMLGDIPASFWPFDFGAAWDRGVTLERAWPELRIPFGRLAGAEREGKLPSMILSPMLVEDGRQLLISNLDLPFLTAAGGNVLNPDSNLYSFPAVEFFKLFPRERDTFELATAVRLNASFPYVSPALYLPTKPYRRAVDAGYYDNYGIAVAASWIFHHRAWIRDNTSGVALIQARAYPKQVSLAEPEPSLLEGLSRSFQFLTSPVEGGATSREAATLFRNDQVLDALDKWFKDQGQTDFFTTVLFENVLDVAMTWYTTEQERSLIKLGFGQDPGQATEIARSVAGAPGAEPAQAGGDPEESTSDPTIKNQRAFEMLEGWWKRH